MNNETTDYGELTPEQESARAAKFDRWLAEHDREVAAQAWDEGESDGAWNYEHAAMIERGNREAIGNPYRSGSEGNDHV